MSNSTIIVSETSRDKSKLHYFLSLDLELYKADKELPFRNCFGRVEKHGGLLLLPSLHPSPIWRNISGGW